MTCAMKHEAWTWYLPSHLVPAKILCLRCEPCTNNILFTLPHIRKLEQFDNSVESWESYEERLQAFFLVNDIDTDHSVPFVDYFNWPKDLHFDEKPYFSDRDSSFSDLK